jgi:hypothetical protein
MSLELSLFGGARESRRQNRGEIVNLCELAKRHCGALAIGLANCHQMAYAFALRLPENRQ